MISNSVIKSIAALAGLGLLTNVSADEQTVLAPSTVDDIPLLGFGTWNVQRSNASDVVATALKTGYRHLDCAAIYGNEKEVGAGIKAGLEATGLSRDEIWITSKLWNDRHAPDDVPMALEQTLSDLGVEYLDLYLMHWPAAKTTDGQITIDYVDTWKAMTELPLNRVRNVGVSNFSPSQLQTLLSATPVHVPYAHQMELHPYLPQTEFLRWHAQHGIHVTAYSPFGNANPTYRSSRKRNAASAVPPLLESPLLAKIAAKIDCTTAQTALAFGIQRGTSVIPKSSHAGRIEENFDAYKCKLSAADIKALETELPLKRFNNPSKGWGVPLYDGLEDSGNAVTAYATDSLAAKIMAIKEAGKGWVSDLWKILNGCENDL